MIKAVVGSGGKTSYIHKLAEEYVSKGCDVFVTTSTHMFAEEDTLLTDDAEKIIDELKKKHYVMAGTAFGSKIKALSQDVYKQVCEYADVVLIEADGSKHMPIKYPADYEPVIYDNVDEIIVVCGIHALGKTFGEVSHRWELVQRCLEVSADRKVEAHHIQKLVRKGYVERMNKMYPDKKVSIKAAHDESLYQRVIAKLIEADVDVSLIKEEWFQTQPELFICGGGHVSYDLVKMASCLDFRITVMDDREEFANRERFPLADEVICDDFEHLDKYLVDDGYYAVITRGHKDDLTCVHTILKRPFLYLGMIGSKSKVKTTYENLKKLGVKEQELESIHAPIGLKIGANTPAEIAVSILGEIIQVKNQKYSSYISRELSNVKEKGMLCIIIEKSGSSPRGEGSMMFVTDEGIIDTIGGGAVEYAAIDDARSRREVFMKEYSLHNHTAQNLGMICGGENKVLFIPL